MAGPRVDVSPGEPYTVVIDGINHKAQKLLDVPQGNRRHSEFELAQLAYIRDTGAFNRQGFPITYFDPIGGRDWEYFLIGAEIAKVIHKKPFGGENPGPGEFGVRRPRTCDLMGGTAAGLTAGGNDRSWGACSATNIFGNQAWTAQRSEWLGDGSQSGDANEFVQNEATFDLCGLVKTQEVATAGDDKWVATIVGIKSFAAQPVVEAILAQYASNLLPDWDVSSLLREGGGHAVKRAEPYIFTPEYGFKLGVLVEVSAPDQLEPLGWVFPTFERLRQATKTYCRIATA